MRKRTLIPLLVLGVVIAVTAALPLTPPGRSWLVGRALEVLAANGIDATVSQSGGNPYRRLRFDGVELSMPGLEGSVATLELRYFLPSLLTAELPLSVRAAGVEAVLDLSRLELPSGGGGSAPVQVRFDQLEVASGHIAIADIPYTLPDLVIDELRLDGGGSALGVEARLATPDGSARLTGRVETAPFRAELDVQRADLTLARHWWQGIEGGVASGTVTIGPGEISSDLTVRDGSLAFLGLAAESIDGSVRYRHPQVSAELRGEALGGPVGASAEVAIDERRWSGTLRGSTDLGAAAGWLLRTTEIDPGPFLEGSADVAIEAEGWTGVTLRGRATGSGALAGLPLEALQAEFGYDAAGVTASADARLAGGTVEVDFAPLAGAPGGGSQLDLRARGLQRGPLEVLDADGELRLGSDGLAGGIVANATIALPDRRLELDADASVTPGEGWQLYLGGGDDRDATLTGAFVLQDDLLTGALNAETLQLPGIEGVAAATLRVDGPPTALPLQLELRGAQPLRPALAAAGGIALDADLRGSVAATLRGSALEGIDGSFGPLTLTGGFDPAAGWRIDGALAPRALRIDAAAAVGVAEVELAAPAFTLGRSDAIPAADDVTPPLAERSLAPFEAAAPAPLAAAATLAVGALEARGVALPARRLELRWQPLGWRLVDPDDGSVALRSGDGATDLALEGLAIELAGRPVRLDGSAALGADGTALELTAQAENGRASLRGDAAGYRAELALDPGFAAAGVALAEALDASAELIPGADGTALELDATLGELAARVSGQLASADGTALELDLTSGEATLRGAWRDGSWRLGGRAELAPFAAALGLPVLAGSATLDLTAPPGATLRPRGEITVDLQAPLAADATVTLTADATELTAAARDAPLQVQGTLTPALALRAAAGPFEGLVLDGGELGGSGALPAYQLGRIRIAPQPWSLAGTLAEQRATLQLGASRLALGWEEGWRLDAELAQPLQLGSADAALTGSAAVGSGLPGGALDLLLALPSGGDALRAAGPFDALALSGRLAAETLLTAAVAIPAGVAPRGDVVLDGEIDLTALRYELRGRWDEAPFRVTGRGTELDAQLELPAPDAAAAAGPLLATVARDGDGTRVRIAAAAAAPRALTERLSGLPAALRDTLATLPLALDGELEVRFGAADEGGGSGGGPRWSGTLRLAEAAAAGEAGAPVAIDGGIELRGDGAELALATDLRIAPQGGSALPPVRLDASGTLLPRLDLSLDAAFADLRARATIAPGLEGETLPRLDAALTIPGRSGVLTLPPLELTARSDGTTLQLLGGDGGDADIDVTLTPEALSGSVALPLSLAGEALRLRLDLAGSPADPAVAATLAGALRGDASYLGGTLELSLTADPGAVPGGALLDAPPTLRATLERNGVWSARLDADGSLAGSDLGLVLTVDGDGLRYRGSGRVAVAGATLLPLELSGSGADATVRADLAGLDSAALAALLGDATELRAEGEIRASTAVPRLAVDARLEGSVAGLPATAALRGGADAVTISGSLAGVEVDVRPRSAGGVAISLLGDRFEAAGFAALGARPTLQLRGAVQGRSLRLDLAPPAGVTAPAGGLAALRRLPLQLLAESGDLRLVGAWFPGAGATPRLELQLAAGGAAFVPLPVDLAATLELPAASSPRVRAAATVGAAESALRSRLTVAGTVGTTLDLEGSVASDLLPLPVPLTVAGPPGAMTVTAMVPGVDGGELTLRSELRGVAPQALALGGAARLGGFDIDATAGLTWNRDGGFGGGARLTGGALGGVPLQGQLQGDGPLAATLVAGDPERPDARLELRLPADPLAPTAPLDGLLTVDARSDAGGFGEQRLAAEVTLGGRLRAPTAAGAVRLAGAVEADGQASYRDGQGQLTLTGPALELTATSAGRSWSVGGSLRAAPLAAFGAALPEWLRSAPLVADATLSSEFEVEGGRAGGVRGVVDPLALTTPRSRIEGRASLADALLANLRVALDLRDLPGAVAGRLDGPLVLRADPRELSAAQLDTALEVSELSVPGSDASLRGSLQLGGALRDPRIDVTVVASSVSGAAEGTLRFELGERGSRGSLRSDLRLAGITTDLRASWGSDGIDAAGSVAAADARLEVAAEGAAVVALQGSGALAGWSGALDPGRGALELAGPLRPLPGPAEGSARLEVGPLVDPAADTPWIRLVVGDATLAGVAFGRVELVAAAGAPLQLRSDHLDATLTLGAPFAWQLELADQPLPGGLVVGAAGSGSGGSGALDLALAGSGALPLELAGELVLNGGDAALELNGEVAGGVTALTAAVGSSGWRGELALENATFGPEVVSLRGELDGPRSAPQLALSSDLAGPVAALGTLRASADGVTLEQRFELPQIAEAVTLTGTVWPAPDLRLEAAGGSSALALRATSLDAPLTSSGVLTLRAGPAELRLSGAGPQLTLIAALPAADAQLRVEVPGSSLPGFASILDEPLLLRGEGTLAGAARLQLRPAPELRFEALRYRAPEGVAALELNGVLTLAQSGGALQGALTLPAVPAIPALAQPSDWTVQLERTADAAWSAQIASAVADATLRLDPGGELVASVDARGEGLRGSAELRAAAGAGIAGEATIEQVLLPIAGGVVALEGSARSDGAVIAGELNATLLGGGANSGGAGALLLSGRYGFADLLPANYRPDGAATGRSALLRLRRFDPAALPLLRARVPNLRLPLSGTVQLEGATLVGSLIAPDAAVAGTSLPVTIDATGHLAAADSRLQLQGTIDDSRFGLTAGPRSAEGTFRLEGFPAQVIAEAVAGATDISASVTGALRWRLPYAAPLDGELRLATEQVRLQRNGDASFGSVTLDYIDRVLTLRDVAFGAEAGEAGSWSATGVVGGGRLQLSLAAVDADFGPLLQLVPALSRFGTSASGSFSLQASGTLDDPDVSFQSDRLEVGIAGGRYALAGARATLLGERLDGSGTLLGLSPLQAELAVQGGATVSLLPLRIDGAQASFEGSGEIPVLGALEGIEGTISAAPGGPPRLEGRAQLGAPLTLRGTLAPFDLRLEGSNLAVSAPSFFLQRSTVDLDVRLLARQGGIDVGGAVFVQNADFALGIRPPRDPAADSVDRSGARAARERVRFDGLRLVAPRALSLSENFGTLEGRADLTLGGTAADPELDGTAEAVRGTVRFSGQDFTLRRAVATFEPSRGVFPLLALEAASSFEKTRVSAGGEGLVRFVAPRDGSRFDVVLTIDGEVLATPAGERAFSVEIDPELSSLARIEVDGSSPVASGPRSLTGSELLTLVTLGRVDISNEIIGQAGLATSVAQTALDTAVDLLVLSELQQTLSAALGVDVVEIRTTNLSELLAGGFDDPFSVSLRVGGYLSDEVFASYRIGSFDDDEQQYALTNEFSITYGLGPLDVDLAGRVNFASAQAAAPTPGLSASVGYDLSSLVSIETGVDLSTERSLIRLGVTLSW